MGNLSHTELMTAFAFGFVLLIGTSPTGWAQTKSDSANSIRGAGSTFAAPLYKKWIDEYGVSHRNVTFSYDGVGSGEGVKRFLAGAVDFAGSDEILSQSEYAKSDNAIMIPTTAGMVVISYNVPGVQRNQTPTRCVCRYLCRKNSALG